MSFPKFFSNLQEAPWYRSFLDPVLAEIKTKGRLLDIGTGSGKMIQILAREKGMDCVGVDTNAEMLAEAKVKLEGVNVELLEITPHSRLPFEDNSFDYITICSVLFHLKNEEIDRMLENSLELLKEGGKIVVHTPTGLGNVLKLTRHYFTLKNKGIYVWHRATRNRARIWTDENYLAAYAKREKLKYERTVVMHGFAQVETIHC